MNMEQRRRISWNKGDEYHGTKEMNIMEQINNTPALVYLKCENIIRCGGKKGEYYPIGRLFNDSCACIAELEREACNIYCNVEYEQWKRDHRIL